MQIGWIDAIIYSMIQGISEAFPVSSSFHFLLFTHSTGASALAPTKAMAAGLHAGSLLALCVIFRYQVMGVFSGFFDYFRQKVTPDRDLFNRIFVSGLGLTSGVILVYGLKYIIGKFWAPQTAVGLHMMAAISIIFALLLECVNRKNMQRMAHTPQNLPLIGAFLMGMSQVLAMICSGISRLGVTLTAGRAMGYSLESSTRYSLIMGMPVLAASILFSLSEITSSLSARCFAEMTVVTFFISWPMFYLMLWFSQKESTMIFTVYRIILAIFVWSFF
jgi:undecaprenyl-diphosphatase